MPETILSDPERRLIGNLGIPRNVENLMHELRTDPHSDTDSKMSKYGDEKSLSDLMKVVEDEGWIVNLGTSDDPAVLAASLESHKTALTLPDEQAAIYADRMSKPNRKWRMKGDLWIITDAGLEMLKKPMVESVAMTPTQVQFAVNAEWDRTLKDIDSGRYRAEGLDQSLARVMLQDEFGPWFYQVAAECERVWGVRPTPPVAGGTGWTDVFENTLIDAENQKATITAAAPWFMALTILAFTDTDTGTTADDGSHKPSYTGYGRISVGAADMGSASAGSSSNANALLGAACTAGSSTVLGFGNCSAATVGILRKYGTCASTLISTTQTPPQFQIGAYVTNAD